MAARPTWKGVLQISLVTIPIKVYPATDSAEAFAFNQLHDVCQTRVSSRRWCVQCAREVPASEIVKGYEFASGKYVLLLSDELDAVQPPSTKVIALTQFAEASALDPVYVDRSYYLVPDGQPAAEAFAVMRQAMHGTVGIGKLAIYGREYLVAVRSTEACAPALLLHTLHHAAEIRAIDGLVEDVKAGRAPLEQLRLARHLISAYMAPTLELAAFTDEYKQDLQRLIDAKIAGQEIVEPPKPAAPQAIALTEALTRSLQAVRDQAAPKRKRA